MHYIARYLGIADFAVFPKQVPLMLINFILHTNLWVYYHKCMKFQISIFIIIYKMTVNQKIYVLAGCSVSFLKSNYVGRLVYYMFSQLVSSSLSSLLIMSSLGVSLAWFLWQKFHCLHLP